MTAPIFISHSSKDQKVARTICTALESRGLACWIANRDVGPGQNFQEAIVRAIRAAKVMVLVFTENANNSAEIKKELALASRYGLMVIPARAEDVVPSEAFELEFATRQWVDLFENWEREIERLSSWIAKALPIDGKPPSHTPTATDPSPQPTMPAVPPASRANRPANKSAPPPDRHEKAPPRHAAAGDPPARGDLDPTNGGTQPSSQIPGGEADGAPSGRATPGASWSSANDKGILAVLVALGLMGAAALLIYANRLIASDAQAANILWMIAATALALIATVPGMILFGSTGARSKHVSVSVLYAAAAVALIWVIYGYSIAASQGTSLLGGLSQALLAGITRNSTAPTFSIGVTIPEFVFVGYLGAVAIVTLTLLVGAVAERTRFAATALIVPLWVTLVFCPIAHMVWYWAGPDAIQDAAKALAAATDEAAKRAAQAKFDEVITDTGLLFGWGTLDYAGGLVVYLSVGVAGLIGTWLAGKRPESPGPAPGARVSAAGTAFLCIGAFALNATANLEAGGATIVALRSAITAAAAGAVVWFLLGWTIKRRPSPADLLWGALAGMVAVTAAAVFAGTIGAAVLAAIASAACVPFCARTILRDGDSAGVFALFSIASIIGALGTGIVVNPGLGGEGIADYTANPPNIADYDFWTQMTAQVKGVLMIIAWSAIGSLMIFKGVDLVLGLRRVKR